MLRIEKFKTEEEWKKHRFEGISATDVGAILGVKAFGKTKFDVFMKVVKHTEKKLDPNNPVLVRGHKLEPLIRKAFEIDYADEYKVTAPPKGNWSFWNDDMPFLLGSLDGIITRKSDKKKGVLEIKTTDVASKKILEDWSSGIIPDTYLTQVLTYLGITKYDFAVLRARIRVFDYDKETNKRIFKRVEVRDYYFDAVELKEQIDYVLKKVDEFWNEYIIPKKIPDIEVL